MTLVDFLNIGAGNLRRMKLRAFLTISGVIIAIGAFVAMLSFGAGMWRNVESQFNRLGLFTTMHVYPPRDQAANDTITAPPLDINAVELLSQVPGVRLAYPFDNFEVTVSFGDTTVTSKAQTLSVAAMKTKLFSRIEVGNVISSDSSKGVVVSSDLLESLQIEEADSVIGKEIIISVSVASLDSGLVHIFKENDKLIWSRFSGVRFDSLWNADYRNLILKRELTGVASRFIAGYLNARGRLSDTLIIRGVLKHTRGRSRFEPIIVPLATGRKFSSGGFTGDLPSLFSSLSIGSVFPLDEEQTGKTFSKVTLDLQHDHPYAAVRDSIEAMG